MSDLRSEPTRRCVTSRDQVVSGSARARVGGLLMTFALLAAAVVTTVLLPLAFGFVAMAVAAICIAVVHRHTLSDLGAGATLLLAQPYNPGEQIRVYLDDAHDIIDAEVLQVRLLRTTLCTDTGMLAVRNAHMLRTTPDQPSVA